MLSLIRHLRAKLCRQNYGSLPYGYEDVRPVRRAIGGSVLNKAGRLVLRGRRGDQDLKIYEAANPEHARFIQAASEHPDLEGLFPEVIDTHGAYVVSEWLLPGQGERSPPVTAIADLQQRLYAASVSILPNPGFDYWQDLIWPRFSRAADLLNKSKLADRIDHVVSRVWRGSSFLVHPDITPANLVCDQAGRWRVIDNELLTLGGLPMLGSCSTALALRPNERDTYIAAVLARGPSGADIGPDALRAAWLARCVSTFFFSGNVKRASEMVMRYEDGESIFPFSEGAIPEFVESTSNTLGRGLADATKAGHS